MRGRGHLAVVPLSYASHWRTAWWGGGGGGLGALAPQIKLNHGLFSIPYKWFINIRRNFLLTEVCPRLHIFKSKNEKAPYRGRGGGGTPPPPPPPRSVATLPRAWSLRSLAKIAPPKCFGSLRHWCQCQHSATRICQARVKARERSDRAGAGGFLPCHGREIFFWKFVYENGSSCTFYAPKKFMKTKHSGKSSGKFGKKVIENSGKSNGNFRKKQWEIRAKGIIFARNICCRFPSFLIA